MGPCAKQVVTCTLVHPDGRRWVGRNDVNNPQKTCPRGNLPSGQGYEKCRDVCGQMGHAEEQALRLAGKDAKGCAAYVEGIHYICANCQVVLTKAGVNSFVLGAPSAQAAVPVVAASDEMLDMLGRIHPLAMSREEADEKRDARLERAFVIQQPAPVPDQACIVWRWDLMQLRHEVIHLRAYKENARAAASHAAPVGAADELLAELDWCIKNGATNPGMRTHAALVAARASLVTPPAPAQPAGADLITYTVDGVVMSPLEYIDYLHGKLATLAPVAAQQAKELDHSFDHLAGRGIHELRIDELPTYLSAVAANHGAHSDEFTQAAQWVASELERKTNDERVIAVKLASMRESAAQQAAATQKLDFTNYSAPVIYTNSAAAKAPAAQAGHRSPSGGFIIRDFEAPPGLTTTATSLDTATPASTPEASQQAAAEFIYQYRKKAAGDWKALYVTSDEEASIWVATEPGAEWRKVTDIGNDQQTAAVAAPSDDVEYHVDLLDGSVTVTGTPAHDGMASESKLREALQSMEMALIGYTHQNDITRAALAKCRAALAAPTAAAATTSEDVSRSGDTGGELLNATAAKITAHIERNKEALLAAWIAENGVPPSEAVLCQQTDWASGVQRCWVERHPPSRAPDATLAATSEDTRDAAMFRWLIEDHDNANVRDIARSVAMRLGTSSYSAITRDIEHAMRATQQEGGND